MCNYVVYNIDNETQQLLVWFKTDKNFVKLLYLCFKTLK